MNEDLNRRVHDLSTMYDYDDRTAVEEFIFTHPHLLPYLEQSAAEIEKYFPESDVTLAVELDEDEEDPQIAQEKLFLMIKPNPELPDPIARLDRLDENWSIDICESTNELLVIDLKY